MTTLYVREQGATVRRRGERLVVTKDRRQLLDVPLLHVEQLAVVGNVQVTTPAVAALLERDVDVVFFSSGFRYRGRLSGAGSKHVALRQAQLVAVGDEARALVLAKAMVAGKLTNQRTLLQRRARGAAGPGAPELDQGVAGIARMLGSAAGAADLDSLRGYEGRAAAWYFGGLKALVGPEWGFKGRAYHPPPDAFNAALSFGYALLLRDSFAAVELVGLDPYLGFFHAVQYGRPSLALDLMEELRPLVVDSLVLGMVAKGELKPADFTTTHRPERPIELGERGLDTLVRGYEERMAVRIQHPVSGQSASYRRCLELQARQVAAIATVASAAYQPVTAR